MKKGRRKDHTWQFVKYKGDIAFMQGVAAGFIMRVIKNILTSRDSR